MNKISLCGTVIPKEDADELYYELFEGMEQAEMLKALDKFISSRNMSEIGKCLVENT